MWHQCNAVTSAWRHQCQHMDAKLHPHLGPESPRLGLALASVWEQRQRVFWGSVHHFQSSEGPQKGLRGPKIVTSGSDSSEAFWGPVRLHVTSEGRKEGREWQLEVGRHTWRCAQGSDSLSNATGSHCVIPVCLASVSQQRSCASAVSSANIKEAKVAAKHVPPPSRKKRVWEKVEG